jgi:hypothetical protein
VDDLIQIIRPRVKYTRNLTCTKWYLKETRCKNGVRTLPLVLCPMLSSSMLLGIMFVPPLPLPYHHSSFVLKTPLHSEEPPCSFMACKCLHLRPSSPPRPPTSPMSEPEHQHPNCTNQPKNRIHQIYPDRMLHPNYPGIPLRVGLDIHIPKQAKERDPQDEEHEVGCPGEGDARGEGDEVEQG